jgi:hypothetical protein
VVGLNILLCGQRSRTDIIIGSNLRKFDSLNLEATTNSVLESEVI